jgi:aquaporin Z
VLAALLAFTFGYMLTGHATGIHPGGNVSWLSALAAELVFSVALVTVVLNVAATRATAGNSYYGIAIGFTVAAGAFAVGPISGAAFNPAVGIGATVAGVLFGHGSWSDVWLYVVGPLAGAAIAAGIQMLQTPARPVTPQSSERRQD